MPPRRDRPPLWFDVCVAVALACAIRWMLAGAGVVDDAPGHAHPVHVAFLQFLLFLGGLIWRGLEVGARITLAALHWVVVNLSLVVTKIGNGLKAFGVDLLKGLKRGWEFTRKLYDDVLKPAWQKFWRFFDKFRRWLDATFRPVLKWLKDLRDSVLKFYKLYVRPWLDLIDVTRKLLRVLAVLHVPFARELDARLGRLQQWIERPFRILLGKINEVINLVNRVVTLDGLVQRLALIRSLERDYIFAWRAATNPWHRLLTKDEEEVITKEQAGKPFAEIVSETRAYMRDGSGPNAPLLDEMAIIWRNYLVRR